MHIQATSRQQRELKQLLQQNERLHAKKSQQLFAKLEAATNDQGDVDFLQNIHLSLTLAFLKRIVAAKKLEAGTTIHQQQQIQKQVLMEYNSESSSLAEQIEQLKREIEEIRSRKDRYLLGQRHASSRISELEEKLGNQMLDLKRQNALLFKKRMDPCLSFGYSKQLDGAFKLKRSYKNIVHHFLKRIQQNQEILNNLQNSVKDRVKQSETIRGKINKCKSLSRYFHNTNDSVDELKRKCQSSKEQLRQRVEAANEEVNKRLPQELDKKIKQIQDTKKTYECAFYALVQIANKVVQAADLSRVTDYINRS